MDEAGRPTGPLWEWGRETATGQAQALENGVTERHATLCNGMAHDGLNGVLRTTAPDRHTENESAAVE